MDGRCPGYTAILKAADADVSASARYIYLPGCFCPGGLQEFGNRHFQTQHFSTQSVSFALRLATFSVYWYLIIDVLFTESGTITEWESIIFMSRFFKFLIMVAAIANLFLLLSFDDQIPSVFRIPFLTKPTETEETEAEKPDPKEKDPGEEGVKEPETAVETAQIQPEEEAPEEEAAKEAGEEEAQEEEDLPKCRVISEYGSNVRSGPGPDYEVVAAYPYDTVFVIIGEPEIGWFPIRTEDGTEGFIFENQIELPEGYDYLTEEAVY